VIDLVGAIFLGTVAGAVVGLVLGLMNKDKSAA
jgi:uncharacterized membrane protein